MKLLVFSDVHGNFELMNAIMAKHQEAMVAISLGNLGIYDEKTPLNKFLMSQFVHEAKEPLEFHKEKRQLATTVYTVYGANDDRMSKMDIPNLVTADNTITSFAAYSTDLTQENAANADVENRQIAFLSGYYSRHYFRKTNFFRRHNQREKRSNALCMKDFEFLRNTKIDVLFSHEAPANIFGKEHREFGSMFLYKTIVREQPSLVMCGHHKKWHETEIGSSKVVCLPSLRDGYAILDLYRLSVTRYDTPEELKDLNNHAQEKAEVAEETSV